MSISQVIGFQSALLNVDVSCSVQADGDISFLEKYCANTVPDHKNGSY